MKMIKGVIILALLMTLTLYVLNIAAASSMSMGTSQSRPHTSTYFFKKFIPDTEYLKNDYPPVVVVNQMFTIKGRLMQNNTTGVPDVGFVGNTSLYHGEILSNVPSPTLWKVKTNAHGNFIDQFSFSNQGQHNIIYTYMYGNGSADFCESDVITIYCIQWSS